MSHVISFYCFAKHISFFTWRLPNTKIIFCTYVVLSAYFLNSETFKDDVIIANNVPFFPEHFYLRKKVRNKKIS